MNGKLLALVLLVGLLFFGCTNVSTTDDSYGGTVYGIYEVHPILKNGTQITCLEYSRGISCDWNSVR